MGSCLGYCSSICTFQDIWDCLAQKRSNLATGSVSNLSCRRNSQCLIYGKKVNHIKKILGNSQSLFQGQRTAPSFIPIMQPIIIFQMMDTDRDTIRTEHWNTLCFLGCQAMPDSSTVLILDYCLVLAVWRWVWLELVSMCEKATLFQIRGRFSKYRQKFQYLGNQRDSQNNAWGAFRPHYLLILKFCQGSKFIS